MSPMITEILSALEKAGHEVSAPVTGDVYVNGVDVIDRLEKTQHGRWTLAEAVEYLTMRKHDE